MTAVTLIMEKTNSASPYPRTPNKLMLIITNRKIVTQAAGFVDLEPSQKDRVMDAAMISSGRVMSQERA